jgi:hypothetical protein
MANRSQEENIKLLTEALYRAGEAGLTIDQAKDILFGDDKTAKSATKKLLEVLKSKGQVHTKVGMVGKVYVINEL